MAIHEELNPDDSALPYLTARGMRMLAQDNAARTAGVIVVPNLDGTNTVLGTNGLAPWVGDTTPPGKPLDIEATSHLGTALIRWGGELEGGIPSDFRCVQVWAKQVGATAAEKTLVGVLSSAGEVNTGVFDAGTTLDVWATALDNAHDRDGSPAYNESVESEHVQVEILPIVSQQEFDEAADNILAAADESVKAQIEQVNKDLQDTSDRIDTKADEILEAAKADATAKADAVDAKVTATNTKVQENADAIKAESDRVNSLGTKVDGQGTKLGEVEDSLAEAKQDLLNANTEIDAAQAAADAARKAAEDALQNAAELLVNGGFEQGPVGWRATDGKAFVQDSPWCRSGVKRAYLKGSAGTREIVSVNPVAVSVGRAYRFAVWYKLLTALNGNDSGGLRLMGTTAATVSDSTVWTQLPPTVDMQYTGDTWMHAVQTVVVPNGVKWIRAAIVFTTPVDAFFDDCSLIDATDVVALETAAANAQATADEAKQAALGAQVTADGKNAIYRQTTDPALDTVTAGKLVAGDLWWQTSEANLETYWLGEPNNSVSVLVDHSDEIEAMWIWNGSRWNRHVLYAQDLLVNGSIVAELLAVDCVEARHIKVGAIEADKLSATALYGHVIKGGTFLTSNERLVINNEGLLLKDVVGNATITMLSGDGSATFRDVLIVGGTLTTPTLTSGEITGGTISGATVTGGTVQTVNDAHKGIKLTGGNLDIYRDDQTRFLRANEAGLVIADNGKPVLTYAKVNSEWTLSMDGAIQSGGEISGAAITGAAIRTNTEWQSSEAAKKYRGLVVTDGGMFAYKGNGKEEYSMAFTAATGELKLDGAISTNAVFNAPTISAGQMVGTNIYTSTNADNRVSITSAGLTVTHGGQTVISFAADGAVDLGTSGIAADSRVSDLTAEVHDSYTPLNVFEQTTDALGESVMDVQTQVGATADRLDEEIDARKQYMRFDPNNGLTIGDLTDTDAYSVQLTSTMMQFRAGSSVAAYVSNDRLYINNADILSTLRIGRFAWIPRANGHMSLQYVGDMGVTATPTEEEANTDGAQ